VTCPKQILNFYGRNGRCDHRKINKLMQGELLNTIRGDTTAASQAIRKNSQSIKINENLAHSAAD
jgi:hypothetical protein